MIAESRSTYCYLAISIEVSKYKVSTNDHHTESCIKLVCIKLVVHDTNTNTNTVLSYCPFPVL